MMTIFKQLPDLLFPQSKMIKTGTVLESALNEAFYAGKASAAIEQTLDLVNSDSSWEPDCFANDVFLKDLLQHCFSITIQGTSFPVNQSGLLKQLCRPPMDRSTIEFRAAISRELAEHRDLHHQAGQLYKEMYQLVHLFNSSLYGVRYSQSSDLTSWRMMILRQTRKVIDAMADGFSQSCSGLARIKVAGMELRASECFENLVGLIEYDANLFAMTLNLNIGADGYLRDFRIVQIEDNENNPHFASPLRRFLSKLLLWFRGYHFSDMELVCNIVERVYSGLEPALGVILQLMGQLEFYLASMGFRELALSKGLEMCLADFEEEPGSMVELEAVFNPLLLRQQTPVPANMWLERGRGCIITGPNSGGKTRHLQAIAIAQLLGQNGLFTPAKKAQLRVMNGMFVSLIEEVGADQKEGRLGMELFRIRRLFEQCNPNSMVILDELCSGTNPSEGTEIFELVLELLQKLEPLVFITTHFLEYALGLASQQRFPELEFRQVVLDGQQEPTYAFEQGVATTSLAGKTARRLGVSLEELNGLIKKRLQHRVPCRIGQADPA